MSGCVKLLIRTRRTQSATRVLASAVVFFKDTATTEIYTYGHTLSLHDALPISEEGEEAAQPLARSRFRSRHPHAGVQRAQAGAGAWVATEAPAGFGGAWWRGGFAIHGAGAVRAGEGVVIASAIFRSKRHHDCGNLTFPAAHSAAASAQQDASRHAETQAIPAAAHRRRPARRELPPGPRGASRGAGGGLRRTDLGPDPRRRRGPQGRHRRAHGRRPADSGQDEIGRAHARTPVTNAQLQC